MATFIGSQQEFLDLFGSTLLTNAVKSYTPKSVKGVVCRHCKQEKELQAAHRHGTLGRIEIAKQILSNFIKHPQNDIVEVDMHEFLSKFYEAHQPINEHFIFLCDSCHKKYDNAECKPKRKKGSNLFCGYGKPKK